MNKRACLTLWRSVVASFALMGQVVQAGDWPQWLGPNRDGHAASDAPAVNKLDSELKVLWRKKIGGGFSSPVLAAGKLVYFDENGAQEIAHLIDAQTGREVWSTSVGDVYQDEWGAGPRSTPIIDGDRVYLQSCRGELRCLDFSSGKIIWGVSFEKDFGVRFLGSKATEGTAARRGNNGSAVVDGDAVIVPVGSTNGATLACFDKKNGKMLWKSGNDETAYSSPVVGTFAGVKQVVIFAAHGLMGFDRKTGRLLWRVKLRTDANRHAMTPVIFGDTIIVASHTFGLESIKVFKEDGVIKAASAWTNKELKINLSTPVRVDNYLYSQGPAQNFICADGRTGELMWEAPGFGGRTTQNSSTIAVGKHLLVLADTGDLALIVAQPEKYEELGRVQACGKNWNFPAYADGKLYVRDNRELVCYDVGAASR